MKPWNNEKYIEAVVWNFGYNRKQAIQYIKENDIRLVKGILDCYKQNVKAAFYND